MLMQQKRLTLAIRKFSAKDIAPACKCISPMETLPWDEDVFRFYYPHRSERHYVAIWRSQFAGYIFALERSDSSLEILNLGVAPEYQNKGIETSLVDEIKKLVDCRGSSAVAFIRESHLSAQLFFRAENFRVPHRKDGGIVDNHFVNNGEPAYVFTYQTPNQNLIEKAESLLR